MFLGTIEKVHVDMGRYRSYNIDPLYVTYFCLKMQMKKYENGKRLLLFFKSKIDLQNVFIVLTMQSDTKWDHWVKEANGHVVIDC